MAGCFMSLGVTEVGQKSLSLNRRHVLVDQSLICV